MRNRRLVVAALAACGLAAPAMTRAAEPTDWNGAYVGLNIGYGWNDAEARYTELGPFVAGEVPGSHILDSDGVVAGVQAGINRQRGHLVYGVEVDLSVLDLEGSDTSGFPGDRQQSAPPSKTTARQSIEWLTTLRGRLGFTPCDGWLVYVTGGLAAGQAKADFRYETIPVQGTVTGSIDEVRTGYVIGGGSELALDDHVSVRIEYLHFDLGSDSVAAPRLELGVPQSAGLKASYQFDGDIVRGAISYRF